MEKLATVVVYFQYFIFPFSFLVIVYVAYSFYNTLKTRHRTISVPLSILKNGLEHRFSPGARFAAAVVAGKISKDIHVNSALVMDNNEMKDEYLRFIGSSSNVREIGEIFDLRRNIPNDAI